MSESDLSMISRQLQRIHREMRGIADELGGVAELATRTQLRLLDIGDVYTSPSEAFQAFLKVHEGEFHISEAREWIYDRCASHHSGTGTLNGILLKATRKGLVRRTRPGPQRSRSGWYEIVKPGAEALGL